MRSRPLPTFRSFAAAALPGVLLAPLLAGCAGAPESQAGVPAASAGFPVEITSCGHTATVTAAPERAVTLNQGATEVVLALGLADRLAGTAYLDDAVPEEWADAYAQAPVLAKEYPTRERLLGVEPDLVYGSYASAFDKAVAGSQDELADLGVAAYLSPFGCPDEARRPAASFDAVWDEVETVARAFGVPERGAELRAEQQATLAGLEEDAAGQGLEVVWFDSGDKTPYVGAGDGGPQLVLDAVGATNAFADLEGGWADGSWESVVAADPDVIVLADSAWSSADDKVTYLERDPVLRQLRAVREGALVTVPFSATTPGVRLVDGAASLAAALVELQTTGHSR